MPAIDCHGQFYARGQCTDKDSRAALAFPIKASGAVAAQRFADKTILELLPGWTRGTVRLEKNGRVIHAWVLTR